MLRFSCCGSGGSERWDLCGELSGPWVDEVRSVWWRIRKQSPRAHAVIDLRNVTFIDEKGERLLIEMQSSGAEFLASGVEHKDLLANLDSQGKRPVRRRMEHLSGGRA